MSTNALTPAVYPVLDGADHAAERTRGYIQGHAAGYAEGLHRAATEAASLRSWMDADHAALQSALRERTEDAVAQLAAAAAALQARTAPVLRDAEDLLAASALELAEAVLGRELADGETSARAALGRVLGRLDGATVPATVRMNPADLVLLTSTGLLEGNPSGGASVPGAAGVTIAADASMASGDAMADYAGGFVDARIRTALERARAALLGAGQ